MLVMPPCEAARTSCRQRPCHISPNSLDFDAKGVARMEGVFTYSAQGNLTDISGKKGSPFWLDYQLSDSSFEIRAKAECDYRYVFPVVCPKRVKCRVDENNAVVEYSDKSLKIYSSEPIRLERTERGVKDFTTIAGLMTVRLFVTGRAGQSVKVRFCENL